MGHSETYQLGKPNKLLYRFPCCVLAAPPPMVWSCIHISFWNEIHVLILEVHQFLGCPTTSFWCFWIPLSYDKLDPVCNLCTFWDVRRCFSCITLRRRRRVPGEVAEGQRFYQPAPWRGNDLIWKRKTWPAASMCFRALWGREANQRSGFLIQFFFFSFGCLTMKLLYFLYIYIYIYIYIYTVYIYIYMFFSRWSWRSS